MADKALEPELVDKLLKKLGSDNKFRAAFRRDPAAALVQLGAPVSFQVGKWSCMRTDRLASKEAIRAVRAIILDKRLRLMNHEFQYLEAK